MNRFLQSSIKLIKRNGLSVVYSSVGVPTYNVETGKNELTKTDYTITVYPKQIQANQYHFPDLVGKESVLFYLANNSLGFTPKVGDMILYKGTSYRVTMIQETVAAGSIVLYRLAGVRG